MLGRVVPSEFNVVIGVPRKSGSKGKGRRVHVNTCKSFQQTSINRVAVWAMEESVVDEVESKLEGDELNEQQGKALDECLGKWQEVLTSVPGKTEVLLHDIKTGEAPPIRSVPYQIPDKWREQVREEISKLSDMGILVPSTSPWSSPIVPVPKKDGTIRICIDFRRVNKVTELDPYFIPLVQEIVDGVGNARYLSKLDLCKGFHQVKMPPEACKKTAVVTPYGKFEFTRMPFGLVNDTSMFQRLMDVVLNGMQDRCSSCVDDVLIYSGEWKEHLGHIEEVLAKLKDAGLTAKVEKCEWGKSQLIYLGHLIGKGRVAVPEDRASAIANYVQPTTKKGVRAFLETAGYYRRFIPKFGAIAAPLTQLTRKR